MRISYAPTLLSLSVALALCIPHRLHAQEAEGAAEEAAVVQEDAADSEYAEQIETLRRELDRAEPELIIELAKSKDPVAGQALIDVYEEISSLGAKLRLVRAYSRFAGVSGIEQAALQKLLDVATDEPSRELRMAAVDELGRSGAVGREMLGILIEAPAEDEVRVAAMELHLKGARKDDLDFYRRLWKPQEDEDGGRKGKKKDDDEEVKKARSLEKIRALAFTGLVTELSDEEVLESVGRGSREVREAAQNEVYRREVEQAEEVAEAVFGSRGESDSNRIRAAEFLLEKQGEEFLEEVEKVGSFFENPSRLRRELAELYNRHAGTEAKEDLVKSMTRGKPAQKLFAVRALASFQDPKIEKALGKLLKDKEVAVRTAAAADLAERRVEDAEEDIEKQLEKAESEYEATEYFRALTRLYAGQAEWWDRVREFSRDERADLRNAAIGALIERRGKDVPEVLQEALAHEDWATRLLAVKALEERRDKDGVGWMIERLDQETGRMRIEISEALFRLTGQNFRRNASAWQRWWAEKGADFEPISEGEAEDLVAELEARRLEDTTAAVEFFGLKIESHRVTFVIDVSGSMEERTKGRYAGEKGPQRLEVAREELGKALDGLEPEALFNVLTFSDKVRPLNKELRRGSEENRDEAKTFLRKLNPSGGTNLFEALEQAFADPEMDTLVVLSDGEPSMGPLIEPDAIRRRVQRWNEGRDVVVHTVAVGLDLDILRWLSEDANGQHVFIP